jgi:hypothetical protein
MAHTGEMTGADWTLTIDGLLLTSVSLTPPESSRDDVEFTDLTDNSKVFLPGIPDNGEIQFVCNYTAARYVAIKAKEGVIGTITVEDPDGLTGECTDSYLKVVGLTEATHDSPMQINGTCKVSGDWTVTAP